MSNLEKVDCASIRVDVEIGHGKLEATVDLVTLVVVTLHTHILTRPHVPMLEIHVEEHVS